VERAFERLAAEWQAIDQIQAAYALPFLFADLTTAVSRIEHDLNRGAWDDAARALPEAEAMLDTLRTRDMDGDGIPDMADPDPWRLEEEPEDPPAPPVLNPIPFGSGSVLIDAESMGYLRGVADFLRQSPAWQLH